MWKLILLDEKERDKESNKNESNGYKGNND